MAPQTSSRFPHVVIERDSDSEGTSSSADEEEMEEEVEMGGDEEDGEDETGGEGVGSLASRGGDGGKGKAVREGGSSVRVWRRRVYKGTGNEAGFQGATYIDCPRKLCFLCKVPDGAISLTDLETGISGSGRKGVTTMRNGDEDQRSNSPFSLDSSFNKTLPSAQGLFSGKILELMEDAGSSETSYKITCCT